jgi:ATP-dependent RNA helicase RhlE
VAPRNKTADRVEQIAYRVVKDQKRHLLVHLFENGARTKAGTRCWCSRAPSTARTASPSSSRAPASPPPRSTATRARRRACARSSRLQGGRIRALVATEVASRGLDIKELPQVVNYELPNVPEDYVHRIGRTARAGMDRRAVSLVAPDEATLLRDIERLLKRAIPVLPLPEFTIPAEPPAGPAGHDGHNGHGGHAGQAHAGRQSRPGGGGGQRHPGSQQRRSGGRHRQGGSGRHSRSH